MLPSTKPRLASTLEFILKYIFKIYPRCSLSMKQ
jgi:hypothetical protein